MEIPGRNFGDTSRGWAGQNFTSGHAPVSPDEIRVTVGGKSAYVVSVNTCQVHVQVPDGQVPGSVPVVVSKGAAVSIPPS
jgi:uncharacterized protein (TIGR03437 family)